MSLNEATQGDKNKRKATSDINPPAKKARTEVDSDVSHEQNHEKQENHSSEHLLQVESMKNTISEIEKSLSRVLTSEVLTFHFRPYFMNEVEEIRKISQQMFKFTQLLYSISKNKENQEFWEKCLPIIKIIILIKNFKYNCNQSDNNTHLNIKINYFSEENMKKTIKYGSIVFINKIEDQNELNFTCNKLDSCKRSTPGIICDENHENHENNEKYSISVFGSSLVRVFTPKYKYIDRRGMFVIISLTNDEDHIGVGEIITFGDLHQRKSNSYKTVGSCTLKEGHSLFLFDENDKTPLQFPKEEENERKTCFVSMTSLPMSDFILEKLMPTLEINKIKDMIINTNLTNIDIPQSQINKKSFSDILEMMETIYGHTNNVYQL